jgi:hypothetical protein
MIFGIYPGSALGDDAGRVVTGPPDLPDAINGALDELQGSADRPFLVRAYRVFTDTDDNHALAGTPENAELYLKNGRQLDLVAQYHSVSGDVDGYLAFVGDLIDTYGDAIATLQIGEEPNVTGNPCLDGWYPRVTDAIVAGVSAAKAKALRNGLSDLKVGCNSTPLLGPSAGFFDDLAKAGGDRFLIDLDYVGLDFFPDVFRPLTADRIGPAVQSLLAAHGEQTGHLPLVITEHGWPTGPGRPPQRQAEILRTVVEAAKKQNLAGYTHFSLRDACSASPDLFSQFGLMTDTYTPKPAFHAFRDLIAGTLTPG